MFSANTSDLECVVSITCTYVKDGGGGGVGGLRCKVSDLFLSLH